MAVHIIYYIKQMNNIVVVACLWFSIVINLFIYLLFIKTLIMSNYKQSIKLLLFEIKISNII